MLFPHIREQGERGREHAPNDVGPCDVAESVIGRPQNTSSWTGSEAMRFCVGVLYISTVIRVHSLESVT